MKSSQQGILEFSYFRGLAPMMWVIFCIGLLEMAVVHFVLVQIWPKTALFLLLVSGTSLLWIFFVIRSLKTHPVLIADDRLVMRCGKLTSINVALADIAAIRTHWESGALTTDGLLKLSLIAYPNIIVDLFPPAESRRFGRERRIHSIAHRIDDLPAFVEAISCKRNIDRGR